VKGGREAYEKAKEVVEEGKGERLHDAEGL
jgi:hypothetical protein